MLTMNSELNELGKVFDAISVPSEPHLLTDIKDIQSQLVALLLKEYDRVINSSDLSDNTKIALWFKLVTGKQICGSIEGLNDLSDVENLILQTNFVHKASVQKAPKDHPNKFFIVYELCLPSGVKATTEWTTVRELFRMKKNSCINTEFLYTRRTVEGDDRPIPIVLRAKTVKPVDTNIFHFVIISENGVLTFHSWSTGPCAHIARKEASSDLGAQYVQLGTLNVHGKVMPTEMQLRAMEDIVRAEALTGRLV